MRRKRNILWYFILLVLIILVSMEFYLPRLVEREIREIFQRETESIENLEIQVSSFPSLEILLKRVDRIIIEARGLSFNGLYLEDFAVEYQDIRLHDDYFTGNNTALNILITEDALNNYIKTNYPELGDFKIELNPDQVFLSGIINFFEARLQIQLAGSFTVTENNEVFFIPENFRVEKINIPGEIIRDFLQDKAFSFDLNELNLPINITQIELSSGEIRVLGNN
jgi:uncharacterized protein YpmS